MNRELNASRTSPRGMSVSVVVPVFNSTATLSQLVLELKIALENLKSDFEILLVNDGSADMTAKLIDELASAHKFVTGIELARNYGQHNALLCGIRRASKNIIVTLDDDLQNPPSELFKMLLTLNEGFDVVYGIPDRETHGFIRNLASLTTKLVLQKAMGAEIAQNISTFRAFRTELRDSFADFRSPFVCIDILLTWGTNRFGAVRVKHAERTSGSSNYTFRKLIVHALNLITGFTVVPLQFASLCGFILLVVGIFGVAFVIFNYVCRGPSYVPGFAFLACAILIFSAAQLLALGIIGEYLARMYSGTMGKPVYRVREEKRFSQIADHNSAAESSVSL